MKPIFILFILLFSYQIFSHENKNSRADIFLKEIQVDENIFKSIEIIDNRYKLQYEKLSAKIQFHNSELSEIIQNKPFNEKKAKDVLTNIGNAQMTIKFLNIKHHLEIETKLDTFQRMKFNEFFSP